MHELVLENPRRRSHRRSTRRLGRIRYSRVADKRHTHKLTGFSVHENPRHLTDLRHIFAGPTLAMGGGAVAASVVSTFVIGKIGGHLPGINNGFGRAVYNLFIPVAGAWALKRVAPNVARGMVIGGLANAFGQIVTTTNLLPAGGGVPPPPPAPAAPSAPAGTAATSMYLGARTGSVNEYLGSPFAESAWA